MQKNCHYRNKKGLLSDGSFKWRQMPRGAGASSWPEAVRCTFYMHAGCLFWRRCCFPVPGGMVQKGGGAVQSSLAPGRTDAVQLLDGRPVLGGGDGGSISTKVAARYSFDADGAQGMLLALGSGHEANDPASPSPFSFPSPFPSVACSSGALRPGNVPCREAGERSPLRQDLEHAVLARRRGAARRPRTVSGPLERCRPAGRGSRRPPGVRCCAGRG